VAAIMQKGAVMSLWEALVVTEQVRAKRAELVALVQTMEAIKMQGLTTAELRAYLRLPLSPGDVVLR